MDRTRSGASAVVVGVGSTRGLQPEDLHALSSVGDVALALAQLLTERRGVETVMVRYPREGHGIRERSIDWYRTHFNGTP